MNRLAIIVLSAVFIVALAAAHYGPAQNQPSCQSTDLEGCLAQYTDTAWRFNHRQLYNWTIAAFGSDIDTTGVCGNYKNEGVPGVQRDSEGV